MLGLPKPARPGQPSPLSAAFRGLRRGTIRPRPGPGPGSLARGTLLLALLGLAVPATAQQGAEIRVAGEGEVQQLQLQDGSVLIGRVVDAGDPVHFELSSGSVVEVPRAQIRSLRLVEGIVRDGEVWGRDPSSNRLFFGPTGRTIGQGRGYLAVFEVFFPSLSFGIHDRFTIGGGTLLVGGIDGGDRPFWFIPKLKVYDKNDVSISVGTLAITALEADGWVGVLYGVGTVGPPDKSLTVGLGYGWVDDDFSDYPAILLGGEARVSKGVKFITENYVIPVGGGDTEVVLTFGPRFFGERLSADLGIGLPITADEADFACWTNTSCFFPLVNFVYNW